MRINTIQLAWFRGASDAVELQLNSKSMVVYGSNGSGKSCFVDAVEYILNEGRIQHLAHEYSGRKQEKAVPNTHAPNNSKTTLSIKFKDDSEHLIEILKDGSFTSEPSTSAAMRTWEYRRTILRQHEVAHFIESRKGEKYSALLPLLGLDAIELVAENLRQLAKSAEDASALTSTKLKLEDVQAKREETFGAMSGQGLLSELEILYRKYCADAPIPEDPLERCEKLANAIDAKMRASSAEQRSYAALTDAGAVCLESQIDAVRTANSNLAEAIEPLIAEKLGVLQATVAYMGKLGGEREVNCPACGRSIPVGDFNAHLNAETERLRAISDTFNARKVNIGTLSTNVKTLQRVLRKPELELWRVELAKGPRARNFQYLDGIDSERLRVTCGEDELKGLEDNLQPLIDAAVSSSKDAPPDAKELSTDSRKVDVAEGIIGGKDLQLSIRHAETLISFINALERVVRDDIRARAEKVIGDISSDLQAMWSILHPGEPIDGVRLYLPDDADKAIDIGLKFHGIEQDSPRLTLSEGHRNSLGLCLFLAMAKREAANDRPLFLDDVVVSFDREHRGMIAEILEKEFSARQVIILTHDRDWYADLRTQLDAKTWEFKALLPYENPTSGIHWSHSTTTFGDARALLEVRPDAAGNDARKIMDVELSRICEKLRIVMPFLRGDKNDKRMAHDFLQRLLANGNRSLEHKSGDGYAPFQGGLDALQAADRLLLSWGNRASHSHDVVRPEATKLIDACEEAIECFKCSSCGRRVFFAETDEWLQCQCCDLRWRFGKS